MTLAVDNLRVYYRTLKGDVQALDGVTFSVADGEIMGLAGESGCGKTTLGKSLIRLDGRMRHVGGTVTLDGVELPIADDSAMNVFRFREVSIVPQYAMSALNPIRKIGRMISELLDSRGVSYDATRPELSRRLALVGLDDAVLDRYPIELSGGQKQRVVMVLSTLMNPSLLIADELTSALDVSTQKAVAEMLVEFRDRAFVKSTIVITHDLSILYQIADTILVMYAGKLVEKGPAGELTRDPRHPYTKLLIGSLPEVGVRISEKRLRGISGKAAVAPRPADRAVASATAVRSHSRSAWRSRPSSRSRPAATPHAGRPLPDAPARERHEGVQDGHVRRGGRDRRLGRELRHPARRDRVAHRRERERQDDGRQDDPAPDARYRRLDLLRREGRFGARSPRSARVLRPCPGGLPGSVQLVQPGLQDRPRLRDGSQRLPSGVDPHRVERPEAACLEDVGLEPDDVLGKYPHQLSGGQLQRLLISRALILDIEILVADEIISMLDASTRIDVLNILGDLKDRGLGVLFVTHDLALGNYISDRVVILQRGRIVEMGPTPKVFANPMHPYTRMLLACVPQLTSKWEETPRNFDEAGAPMTLQLVDDDHYVER